MLGSLFKDSTTGKTSSTKIMQTIMLVGVIIVCVIWAINGTLTPDTVTTLFMTERGANILTRGVKAYNSTHDTTTQGDEQSERT